jgi:fumarate hydratase class II
LVPKIGYDKAAWVARTAHIQKKTLLDVLTEHKILTKEEYESCVDQAKKECMTT